jgi:hypothetical protein
MPTFLGDCIRTVLLIAFIVFLVLAVPPAIEFMQYGIGASGMGGAPR